MSVEAEKAGILSWLDREDWPGDVYELLGRKRFDPDMAGMCDEVTAGAREVLPYQTHADSAKAMRAMRLLTEFVGRAADVFSSAEKVGEENDRLYHEIRNRWIADNGEDASNWKRDALVMWLSEDADVHDQSVDEIADVLPKEDQESATKKSKVIHPEIGDDVEKPMMPIILDTPEAAAPVILDTPEPVAPAIISEPDPPAEAAAPVIIPAAPIVEEPKVEPGRKRVFKPKSGSARSGEHKKVTPPKMPSAKSGTHAAVKPTKPQPPKQPAPATRPKSQTRPRIEPEAKSKKPIALAAMMIGLPVLLLAAALIWKFYPKKSETESVADNNTKTKTTDDGTKTKTPVTPVKSIKVGPVVKTPAERFADYMAQARRAGRGTAASREAYRKALDVATTTSQQAQVYAHLSHDPEYLRTQGPARARTIIELLSRDATHYASISKYASRLDKPKYITALLNSLHARIARGEDRLTTEQSLPLILSNRQLYENYTLAEAIEEWVRAYSAVSDASVKNRLPSALTQVVKIRRKTIESLKVLTAQSKTSTDKAAAAALLADQVDAVLGSSKLYGTADMQTIDAAVATVGGATTSSLRHRLLAKKLYTFAKQTTRVDEVAALYQKKLETNKNDKFAEAVLSVIADESVADATKLRGPARAAAVANAWKLAGPGPARAKLAESVLEDADYIKQAGFEQVLKFHEAVVTHHLGPSSKSSDYQKSVKLKALIRFIEEHKKLDELEKRYIAALKSPEEKVVAQAVLNEIAKARAKAARPKLGSKWSDKDFMAIETALKHADGETIASQYRSLMIDSGFVRSLTFKDYLLTEEKIVAGSAASSHATALARLRAYLIRLPNPSKNPAANRRAVIGRFRNARSHFLKRLKEDKDNKAAKVLHDYVDSVLKNTKT